MRSKTSLTRWIVVLTICLASALSATAQKLSNPCKPENDPLTVRVFAEYGSMFAADGVKKPPVCIFKDAKEVSHFQSKLKTRTEIIHGFRIELQREAMGALMDAIDEAAELGLRITPLDGEVAAKRDFDETVRLWNSRFVPALNHWVRRGKIERAHADLALEMKILDQVRRVLEWEAEGYFFSTGKNRSIMSSVAPPGSSQHLSLLAFDVEQVFDRRVRAIMNKNGWFQTVIGDSPHFTYIGVPENELPKRGLRAVAAGGFIYWVPNLFQTAPG